jgi:cbb3-type cytochrome oxidase subunit 3
MDVNDLRVIVTVTGLVLFLALVARTWSRRAKAAHDEAARLPFQGETDPEQGEHP